MHAGGTVAAMLRSRGGGRYGSSSSARKKAQKKPTTSTTASSYFFSSSSAAASVGSNSSSSSSAPATTVKKPTATERLVSLFNSLSEDDDDPSYGHVTEERRKRAEMEAQALPADQKKLLRRLMGLLSCGCCEALDLLRGSSWSAEQAAELYFKSHQSIDEVATSIMIEAQRIDLVQQFEGIAGIDEKRAVELLRLNDWNLPMAIEQNEVMPSLDSIPTGKTIVNASAPPPCEYSESNTPVGIPVLSVAASACLVPRGRALSADRQQGVDDIDEVTDHFGMDDDDDDAETDKDYCDDDESGEESQEKLNSVTVDNDKNNNDNNNNNGITWVNLNEWLKEFGLLSYEDVFIAQELTEKDSIKQLTTADLQEMGITTIGARKKFEAAIAALNR